MLQVSLTPSESKKLIAKSLTKLDYFRDALENGIVLIHPSSTTYFLYKEITGKYPEKSWVCGVIVEKGACINQEMLEELKKSGATEDIGKFSQFWVFKRGELLENPPPVLKLVKMMGKRDVYVKTGNAIDPEGNVGVLVGAPDGRGTVGRLYEASKERGFKVLIPIGLEKLVPSVKVASNAANPKNVKYSYGMPLYLFPISGHVVTEIEAIKILTGAKAVPIASGGLSGAEGSTTLVVDGTEEQLIELKEILREVKGVKLPKIQTPKCDDCVWRTSSIYDFENLARWFD